VALRRVRFARYPGQSARIIFAPLFLAQEHRYFAQEGIAVDVVEPEDHPWQAVARGEADAGVGYIDYCAQPQYEGRFKAVAVQERLEPGRGLPVLLARPNLIASGVLETSDGLRGRRIGLTWGRGDDYLTYYGVLHRAGLSINDVTAVAVPHEGDERRRAIANGEIEIIIGRRPRQIASEVTAGTLGRWKVGGEIFPGWQNRLLLYATEFINRDAAAGIGFLRAYRRGVIDYAQGTRFGQPSEEFLPLLSRLSEEEPSLLTQTAPAGFPADCVLDVEGLERDVELLKDVGLFPPDRRVRDVIDPSFGDALA
jgi:ABC-type nitrate/sulfonate/bicarbonate transport system substrate-binding protein